MTRPVALLTLSLLTACTTENAEIPTCQYTVIETIPADSPEGQEMVLAQWADLTALAEVQIKRHPDGTVAFDDDYTWTVADIRVERREYDDSRELCPNEEEVVALSATVALASVEGLDLTGDAERIVGVDDTWHFVKVSSAEGAVAPSAYSGETCMNFSEPSDRFYFAMGHRYPDVVDHTEPTIGFTGPGQSCVALLVVPRDEAE